MTVEPGRDQRQPRAAGRNDLDAVVGERAGELDQAGLVGNGNQGAGGAAQELCHGLCRFRTAFYTRLISVPSLRLSNELAEYVRSLAPAAPSAQSAVSLTTEISAPSRARGAGVLVPVAPAAGDDC